MSSASRSVRRCPTGGAPSSRPSPLNGWGCRLAPLDPERHGPGLWQAFSADSGAMWTYLTTGPYATEADMLVWLRVRRQERPQFYTIFDEHGEQPLGLASYLRIDPLAGSIEVGWLHFSPPCSARGWRRRRWR